MDLGDGKIVVAGEPILWGLALAARFVMGHLQQTLSQAVVLHLSADLFDLPVQLYEVLIRHLRE